MKTNYIKKLFVLLILLCGNGFDADAAQSVTHTDSVLVVNKEPDNIRAEAARDAVVYYKDHSFLIKGILLSWLLTPIGGYFIMQNELDTAPTDNLNMPIDKSENPAYVEAYRLKAWEIKKRRIQTFFTVLTVVYATIALIGIFMYFRLMYLLINLFS